MDVAELEREAASPEVSGYLRDLLPLCGNRTLVRVDRVELTKNILRGFRAFSMLLERRPELRGEIRFLAFLVPPQEDISEYEEVRRGIDVEVQLVNNRFGTGDWAPISVFYQHDYLLAIAALKVYDALLVNPLMDGMNLVAKEGPVVNSRDGVLVLSETAGAYEQLRSGAVPVVPGDVEGTADALYRALTAPGRASRPHAGPAERYSSGRREPLVVSAARGPGGGSIARWRQTIQHTGPRLHAVSMSTTTSPMMFGASLGQNRRLFFWRWSCWTSSGAVQGRWRS